jgi:hypothetical protein
MQKITSCGVSVGEQKRNCDIEISAVSAMTGVGDIPIEREWVEHSAVRLFRSEKSDEKSEIGKSLAGRRKQFGSAKSLHRPMV